MPCYDVVVEKSDSNSKISLNRETINLALIGSPNVGKSSLFNELTGLNASTANFSGTTVENKIGHVKIGAHTIRVHDLPGIYSLSPVTIEENITCNVILGKLDGVQRPDIAVIVADATNIERSLFLISQLFEHHLPTIVALNVVDLAQKKGMHIDIDALSAELGCPVIPTVARTGEGIENLKAEIDHQISVGDLTVSSIDRTVAECGSCGACPFQSRYNWSEKVTSKCVDSPTTAWGHNTERIDKILTHPVVGVGVFMMVMLIVFYLIFSVANIPMELIDKLFARIGAMVAGIVPAGKLQSLLVDGIIGGVGGMLVFLPQICILFFFLALLEDSGYLARAAFVMDRLMRKVGLPGTAFVPLLSAHACAIPAIMATRVIGDPRDRLVTILVAPLMTCSARIPVYAMVTALLFPNNPAKAAMVFTGAYALGIVAAIVMAYVFKRTILAGESKPMILELPDYRVPRLKAACYYTWDRGKVFIQQAGTIILLISIILWVLATFPESEPPTEAVQLTEQAELLAAQGENEQAAAVNDEAETLTKRHLLSQSIAGRLGKLIEPVVSPLGFDWQIGIGIISSFAAREVIVSTLAIVYGVGGDSVDDDPVGLYETLKKAKRSDNTPVFTTATSMSLLVFYVLAMQCLPTQVVTKRETGSVKWAIFQFTYMTVLAYAAAFITFNLVNIIVA